MRSVADKICRIIVFIEGGDFSSLSNGRDLESSLDLRDIFNSISKKVSEACHLDISNVVISELHGFHSDANCFDNTVFEDILIEHGGIKHYPDLCVLNRSISEWVSLEALELIMTKKPDCFVIIANENRYSLLLKKINSYGVKTILLNGTSGSVCEDITKRGNVKKSNSTEAGEVLSIRQGYGFIKYPNNNLFFHYHDVIGDFSEIKQGDTVEFIVEQNNDGNDVAKFVRKVIIGENEILSASRNEAFDWGSLERA